MKILFIHKYFALTTSSSAIRGYKNVKVLLDHGHEVTVICSNDGRNEIPQDIPFLNGYREMFVDGIRIIQIQTNYSNNLNYIRRSIAFIWFAIACIPEALFNKYDLIFATSTPLTVSITGIFLRWIKGTPFVFEVRDLWPETLRALGFIKNPFLYQILKIYEFISYFSADACIGLSRGMCKGISSCGISQSKIYNIPNACDLDIFSPLETNCQKSPELIAYQELNYPLSTKDFVAVFSGAHGVANGLNAILDMALELKIKNINDIQILFIGEGSQKENLKQRAKKQKLDNCHFLSPIPKPDLAKLLKQSAHVGLMVLDDIPEFQNGTSPNKFFDYIASGLPVINNYPGWLADLITENNAGIVVPPKDAKGFAEALIRIKNDANTFDSMSANAYELGRSNFSREFLTSKWIKVLESVHYKYAHRRINYLRTQFYAIFKNFSDRLSALIAIFFLSPLLVCIALLVIFNLGTPIFYLQERTGYLGKPFFIYKFRTMTNERDECGNLLPDIQRLTSFGKWLRKTSIDELPELFNILKGQMSFIGPRPFMSQYLPLYSKEQSLRHQVRPGFSGWAQINGRNNISWEEKFRFDIWYVKHRGLVLDLRILIITIIKVFIRDGVNASSEETMPIFTGSFKGEND